VNGAFVSADGQEVGSPGSIAAVPEPGAWGPQLAAACAPWAHAANTLDLGRYGVSSTYALDILGGTGGGISGLGASAVAYARDRGTLFFVGDEGTGVIEISLTGQALGHMNFDWTGTGSTKRDTEGLTYLGGGVLVVSEEGLQDAYRFNYTDGGSFATIKRQAPQNVLAGSLGFGLAPGSPPSTSGDGSSPPGGSVSAMASLFDPALLGVSTLSDVQTRSSVDALAGTPGADNLLILSLGSRRLLEVNRLGQVLSFFDLSQVLPANAIEGVTVDERGTIYLLAGQDQTGSALPGVKSQLIVLSPVTAVPELPTLALMALGLSLVGVRTRRRHPTRASAQTQRLARQCQEGPAFPV